MEVNYIDHMGTDLSVVNAARVSFNKASDWIYRQEEEIDYENKTVYRYTLPDRLEEKDEKLINYLAKHKHFSPFNHTFITMHVKAPIFVARQLVKHEYMPWNEVSRRYVDSEPEFYEPEWRLRAPNVKQGSSEELAVLPVEVENSVSEAQRASLRAYDELLGTGVAPEVARALLPQNMYTEWWWSGTLKAWMKMILLRLDSHAQKETGFIAEEAIKILDGLYPVSSRALYMYGVE